MEPFGSLANGRHEPRIDVGFAAKGAKRNRGRNAEGVGNFGERCAFIFGALLRDLRGDLRRRFELLGALTGCEIAVDVAACFIVHEALAVLFCPGSRARMARDICL